MKKVNHVLNGVHVMTLDPMLKQLRFEYPSVTFSFEPCPSFPITCKDVLVTDVPSPAALEQLQNRAHQIYLILHGWYRGDEDES